MSSGRFTVFLTIVLSIWAVLHTYVFWRISTVPWVMAHFSRRALIVTALALWISYPLARMLSSYPMVWPFEFGAAFWLGTLFLLFSALLVVDVLTLGGWLMTRTASAARSWAIVSALVLSSISLIQGLRPPVVRDYEVQLPGLPRERDGLILVELSDIHLGTLIGQAWMTRLVDRVNEMKPDVIMAVGDIVDSEADRLQPLLPVLRKLRAPLGVWAVTGNHEFYVGLDRSIRILEEAGYNVLQDRWAQLVPGLVVAGVNDLGARGSFGLGDHPVEKALANRPAGAVIYLSHTPVQADVAAANGAGLMLSGHTHNGQIWPFTYLVRLRYSLMAGRYSVNGMPVIVCRGTGTWGPRMRLWRSSEIVRIKLRSTT